MASLKTSSFAFYSILILLCTFRNAVTIPATPSHTSPAQPTSSTAPDFSTEISYYALPFGSFGLLSHLLTYHSIIILSRGCRPLKPWQPLKHPTRNYWLAGIKLVVTTIASSYSIANCHKTRQFLAMAAWKLDLSLTFGFISLHANNSREDEEIKSLWWLLLHIPGVIAGLAAVFSLAGVTINSNHDVMLVTAVFSGVAGVFTTVCIVWGLKKRVDSTKHDVITTGRGGNCFSYTFKAFGKGLTGYLIPLCILGILAALYSDWILAAVLEIWLDFRRKEIVV